MAFILNELKKHFKLNLDLWFLNNWQWSEGNKIKKKKKKNNWSGSDCFDCIAVPLMIDMGFGHVFYYKIDLTYMRNQEDKLTKLLFLRHHIIIYILFCFKWMGPVHSFSLLHILYCWIWFVVLLNNICCLIRSLSIYEFDMNFSSPLNYLEFNKLLYFFFVLSWRCCWWCRCFVAVFYIFFFG